MSPRAERNLVPAGPDSGVDHEHFWYLPAGSETQCVVQALPWMVRYKPEDPVICRSTGYMSGRNSLASRMADHRNPRPASGNWDCQRRCRRQPPPGV